MTRLRAVNVDWITFHDTICAGVHASVVVTLLATSGSGGGKSIVGCAISCGSRNPKKMRRRTRPMTTTAKSAKKMVVAKKQEKEER